ncbi:MAG: insulinase family protein [Verrucomicrobia bacterium]|nr:MAG: insulinase family protein [Verrucomicrobiota bacterium]TAE85245.1 MAG: insulinase family protein [Verrucomicrobiota bacterium]TAF23026.1 MAG: insulinase family protein [Verrucomicrobiota bacterium]
MRNPAPILLSLLLAAITVFFMVRGPDASSLTTEATPPPAQEVAAKATTTDTKEEPVAEPPALEPNTVGPESMAKDWPHEESDIPADPKTVFGKLPNGMRYMIHPNSEPPSRLSLRLHIAAGSLMESQDQRGLAHFLEHMVFNGSKNFTPDELIPRMQRLGIAFGAHVNAYTSFDETVYMLDLPDLSDEMLKLGFTVMRDFGDGAKLEPAEIDKERGVILAEKTSRDSVNYRLMEQQFNTLLSGSKVPTRFPIGIEEVIQTAPRERFVDFYTRYYTPDRMTFVVVGDLEPAAAEARIREAFGSMPSPIERGPEPDLGAITAPTGVVASIFSDKEVATTDLSLTSVRAFSQVADTRTRRLSKLPLELAHAAISRRFERISKTNGSAIASGSASRYELFNHAELGAFDVSVAGDRWQEALPVLEQEFRRSMEFGFNEAEITEAKANLLNVYQQAVKGAASRKSDSIATAIARSINSAAVFSTPETDLDVITSGLENISAETCHAAFREFWADQGLHLVLTTKDEPANGRDEMLAIYEKSRATPVEAPAARSSARFAYGDFGPAGEIESRVDVADPALVQCILSNGVRVNFKRTDFEKSSIRLLARFGSGKISQPKGRPGLDFFTASVFDAGGLGKHSVDELQQILAGRNVSSSFSVADDSFTLNGRTTPEDLELQLQLMCAQLVDPGFREEALTQFNKAIPPILQQLHHSPAGAQAAMDAWLHGGDSRWAVPTEDQLSSFTLDEARTWLTPALTKGYLELSIVGDFDEKALIPLVLKTFGALPSRASEKPKRTTARQLSFPKAPKEVTFTYESKISQGTATVIWRTDGLRGNQRLFRRLNLLGEILSDRLREEIREKLGASYSPNAAATGSEGLDDFGYIAAECAGKAEDAKRLADLASRLAGSLAQHGTEADELERARKPLQSQLLKAMRDNSYWLNTVLAKSQEDPTRLDLIRERDADYASITADELNEIARKYLSERNALKVLIRPEK